MKYVVWILVVGLFVAHQDYWQWSNATLDFGFLPRALTYHIGVSLAATGVWILATTFCWPESADAPLENSQDPSA